MPARILILDAVATNRIVLKVKMQSAHFAVDACANLAEAELAIARNKPDLILLNINDRSIDGYRFCKVLRDNPATASIAVIAMAVADTAQARFAALDAGADDIWPRPINDSLMLARIRSLLRVRSAGQELRLRESTSRALGFEGAKGIFTHPAEIALITRQPDNLRAVAMALASTLGHNVTITGIEDALDTQNPDIAPDLLIIDARDTTETDRTLFGDAADLRSRSGTRLATQLVLTPPDTPEIAAQFLDIGADDAVAHTVAPEEIVLRAKALIARKQQHDQLRATVRDGLHAALTDPLTGLYNRRYLAPHLAQMARQAQNSGRGFAVLMLDIDHFKAINDAYGHAAGDQVLVQLARRLRENLRAIDLVARVGGEEFLVAMPRTSVRQARLAADRLRRMVNNRPFDIGNRQAINVTVSVGVAVSEKDAKGEHPMGPVCASADRALFAAKSAGRNQVAMGKSAA